MSVFVADFEKNNPAGRLYVLAKKATSIGAGETSALRLWANVFGVSLKSEIRPADVRTIVDHLREFDQLIDETEKGFHELELEDFYFEPFQALRSVVLASLSLLMRFHAIFEDESLGSYERPEQAAEDLAGLSRRG